MSVSTEDRPKVDEPAAPPKPSASGTADSPSVFTHRQPRASRLATASLLMALPAVLAAATGVLAAPGAALGALGLLLALAGLNANRHRHIVGRGNALIGLVLGLAAIAIGALAMTGVVPGLNTETNQLGPLVEWLDANAPWARP